MTDSALRKLIAYQFHAHWHLHDRLRAGQPDHKHPRCIVCGWEDHSRQARRHEATCQFGGGDLVRHECCACGAIFGDQKILSLSPMQLKQEYQALYSFYSEGDQSQSELRAFRMMGFPAGSGPFLNWGCGAWSDSIAQLRSEGFDVWGFEPAAPSTSPFVCSDQSSITAKFEGIFSNNVVEHFLDPVQEFEFFHSLLKPGGLMAHASPCFQYKGEDTLFHTVFYTGDCLRVLCERTGFRIKERVCDGPFECVVFERL